MSVSEKRQSLSALPAASAPSNLDDSSFGKSKVIVPRTGAMSTSLRGRRDLRSTE